MLILIYFARTVLVFAHPLPSYEPLTYDTTFVNIVQQSTFLCWLYLYLKRLHVIKGNAFKLLCESYCEGAYLLQSVTNIKLYDHIDNLII